MKRFAVIIPVLLLLSGGILISPTSAITKGFSPEKSTRKLNITRECEIPVNAEEKTTACLPALMSFWGATNQQVILQSDFSYSEPPDEIIVTAGDSGAPRKFYELTWNSPKGPKIKVKQTLVMEAACNNTLYTAATLPYPGEIATRFESALANTDTINPENPRVDEIAQGILKKTKSAEEAVELACDWINENVEFKSKAALKSDDLLVEKKGNCTAMSQLACAILRKMGIPAEMVSGKFIGANGGHSYIEVYFPDAGWVFYDLSNKERGFKLLDCLMAVGDSCRIRTESGETKWVEGFLSMEKDAVPYKDEPKEKGKVRDLPKKDNVMGVKVIKQAPPKTVKVRHLSLRELILDESIPPGKREYTESKPEQKPK